MAKTYNRLDIEINKDILPIITAVQDDIYSRYLDVNLFENGAAIDLTEHKVRIYIRKKDGTEIFNIGQVTDAESGRVQFELTSQTLAVCGELQCQIIIFTDEEKQVLSTNIFKIFVTRSLKSDNAIESSNEYGALVVLFQNIYEALQLMTDMVHKIGNPGEISNNLNLSTMFEVWEYLLNFVIERIAKETNPYVIENKVKELLPKIQSFENNMNQKLINTAKESSNYAIENKIKELNNKVIEIENKISEVKNEVVEVGNKSGTIKNIQIKEGFHNSANDLLLNISEVDTNKTIVIIQSIGNNLMAYLSHSTSLRIINLNRDLNNIKYYVQIIEFY